MLVGLTMDGKKVKTQETVDRYDLGIFYPAENDPKQITDLAIQAPLDEDETELHTKILLMLMTISSRHRNSKQTKW